MPQNEVILKPGRQKSLLRRHPWIFSGAIDRVIGEPGYGETVLVLDSQENPLAQGAFSPQSNIRVRIWSWDLEEVIDATRFSQLQAFPWDSKAVYHESGIPPLHTPIQWLNSLPKQIQKKTVVYHIARKDFPKDTALTLATFGIENTLYFKTRTPSYERTYEVVDGANIGGDSSTFLGEPLAAFPIDSHFDIQRQYNPATGETSVVTEENTRDRMWWERDYMRVDWTTNNVMGYYWAGLDAYEALGYVERQAVALPCDEGSECPDGWQVTVENADCPQSCRDVMRVPFGMDAQAEPDVTACAGELGVSLLERTVFLDNESSASYIEEALQHGVRAARRRGDAVLIGHVQNAELAGELRRLLPGLAGEGVRLVAPSVLASEGRARP